MVRSVRLQPVAPPVLLALPVLAVSLLAAGCGAGQTAPTAQRPAAEHSAAGHSADEHAAAMTAALGTPAAPPATATMVCGQDIKSKVKQVLTLPAEPATSSTWANGSTRSARSTAHFSTTTRTPISSRHCATLPDTSCRAAC